MNKNHGKIVGIVILGLLLVVASLYAEKDATDPEAKEAILQAFKNIEQAEGFRFESEETTHATTSKGDSTTKATVEGVWQNPDLSYMKGERDEKEFEIYKKGTEAVRKNPESGEWEYDWRGPVSSDAAARRLIFRRLSELRPIKNT